MKLADTALISHEEMTAKEKLDELCRHFVETRVDGIEQQVRNANLSFNRDAFMLEAREALDHVMRCILVFGCDISLDEIDTSYEVLLKPKNVRPFH